MMHLAFIVLFALPEPSVGFTDVTGAVGLGEDIVPETVARVCFADLNADGWPDIVLNRHRVFLSTPEADSPIGRSFKEVPQNATGLLPPQRGGIVIFTDLDNDGYPDAVCAESIDINNENWIDHGQRTGWHRGSGDGTFGQRNALPVQERTVVSIAAGDVNRDGWLDLYFANQYEAYGKNYEGYPNDLLLSDGDGDWNRHSLGIDHVPFNPETDAGARPSYGCMIFNNPVGEGSMLLDLNYGRRWNRAWVQDENGQWIDIAPRLGLHGDNITHGEYPDWLKERAKTDPRFDRKPEMSFRANGNTFDAAVGDVDNDGDDDLVIAEITHGWAGESSDRSRFLFLDADHDELTYRVRDGFDVDRIPLDDDGNEARSWNHGDLFCELADVNHDGRLDLILSSGDYPDNQRLRIYLNEGEGVRDATAELRLDHDGSQQISLADVDGDGDLDILAGQTFNRFRKEQKEGRSPHPRLFINTATQARNSIILQLQGNGRSCNRSAIGAEVTVIIDHDGEEIQLRRQLVGAGGHAGKQHDPVVHIGLENAGIVRMLSVNWPDADRTQQTFEHVAAGRYRLTQGESLEPMATRETSSADNHETAYAGLALRDIPGGHTIISWIFPGPLQGKGIMAPARDLGRPDVLVSVNDEPMNAEAFKDFVRRSAPGEPVTLRYRRANNRSGSIPSNLDHEEAEQSLTFALARRDDWRGTIGLSREHEVDVSFDQHLLDPFDHNNVLGRHVAGNELDQSIEKLVSVFHQWRDEYDDANALSRVRAGFENPFCLPELAQLVSEPIDSVADEPVETAVRMLRANLDLKPHMYETLNAFFQAPRTDVERRVVDALNRTDQIMSFAIGDMHRDHIFARSCLNLLRVPRETFYLQGESTREHVQVIQQSRHVDFTLFPSAVEAMVKVLEIQPNDLAGITPMDIPEELAGAVEGHMLSASFVDSLGWIVIGSGEHNRYDMSRISVVIDPAGHDTYFNSALMIGNRVILDFAGNDTYTGSGDQGPAGALLGINIIDDRSGNDRYEGQLLSCGAAMYGVGLLIDRNGADTYSGRDWSIGAGTYGGGMLFDLGKDNDTYLGEFLCQGVGGPRGLGCMVDERGNDLYRANGPKPSVYDTPGVFNAFSQGIGFGYRHYAAGGVGLLCDLAGNDRYEAGEFAQGGAYYFGLGILNDRSGRDVYFGNRYGQGFGVHQAMGVLADDAGDDTYWSMTAASQGSGWDIGAGLLIDRAGNDSYQCDGLGQGGASHQAVGMLVDLDGVDRYAAPGSRNHGESGQNNYHYHKTQAFSFSLLMDLGSDADWYSTNRSNDHVESIGTLNEDDVQNSGLNGLFIDQ